MYPTWRQRHPAASRPAGPEATGPGRSRCLLRDQLLEVRRLGRVDLLRGSIRHPGQVLQSQVRGKLPDRIRPDVPDGLRRPDILPVPERAVLGEAVRRHARRLHLRLQGPRGHHGRDLAETRPVRETGRACERALPERQALEQFFTSRLERYGKQVGPLIFEFGTFNKKTFPTPADFLAVLDPFLKALPKGSATPSRSGTRIISRRIFRRPGEPQRRPRLQRLDPDAGARRAGPAPGVFTADFTVVRALLRRGRPYEKAVETFEPYDRIQEPNESAEKACG